MPKVRLLFGACVPCKRKFGKGTNESKGCSPGSLKSNVSLGEGRLKGTFCAIATGSF